MIAPCALGNVHGRTGERRHAAHEMGMALSGLGRCPAAGRRAAGALCRAGGARGRACHGCCRRQLGAASGVTAGPVPAAAAGAAAGGQGRRCAAQALWPAGGDRRDGRRPDDGAAGPWQPVAAAAWCLVPGQFAGPAGHAQPAGCADVPAGGRCRAGPGGAARAPVFRLHGQSCRHRGAVRARRRPRNLAVSAARPAGRGLHRIRTFRWHIDEHHGLPCVAAHPCRPRYHADAAGADRDCLRGIGRCHRMVPAGADRGGCTGQRMAAGQPQPAVRGCLRGADAGVGEAVVRPPADRAGA
ncbi:Uncharacterised protein [Stenotrophomonas maltophilia]|nr:Uncharacterised protein [Stenotrophomonas maltophilia]